MKNIVPIKVGEGDGVEVFGYIALSIASIMFAQFLIGNAEINSLVDKLAKEAGKDNDMETLSILQCFMDAVKLNDYNNKNALKFLGGIRETLAEALGFDKKETLQ